MLPREKCDFVAPGVSIRAVNDYFATCLADGQEIQTLQIWDRDKMLVRIAPEPYSCTDKRELFSLSKTFCSTAVGCAVDEGLLSPDDRVVDLFPDDLPEAVSENLAKMRVRHVLSMNCGHAKDSMPPVFTADSVPRAFLALPVEFEPGTHFTYNTGATCMLAAIVRKVTGETVFDYLNRKILVPLGIRGSVWNITRDGTNEGGCGFQASSDDIAALGRLYLNRGVWEGKRLLSEKWIDDATFPHSDNSRNGTPDWRSGYGYQIWVNAREGFRGDGAYGQLMFVLPKTGIIIAVQARVLSMQKEVDNLYDLAAHLFDDDGGAVGLNVPPFRPLEAADEPLPFTDTYYKTEPNPFG
ncbi:MAG: serine hydrolase, partial [Clostridia bacterium]|nr:serine hydrolase [Clostridia bacterium]